LLMNKLEVPTKNRDVLVKIVNLSLKKYDATEDQILRILFDQKCRCARCAKFMDNPVTDHRHSDGVVRGIVCTGCNTGIIAALDRIDDIQEKYKSELSWWEKYNKKSVVRSEKQKNDIDRVEETRVIRHRLSQKQLDLRSCFSEFNKLTKNSLIVIYANMKHISFEKAKAAVKNAIRSEWLIEYPDESITIPDQYVDTGSTAHGKNEYLRKLKYRNKLSVVAKAS